MIIWTKISLLYNYEIFIRYGVDDENLPKTFGGIRTVNVKPWQYEELNLPQ